MIKLLVGPSLPAFAHYNVQDVKKEYNRKMTNSDGG